MEQQPSSHSQQPRKGRPALRGAPRTRTYTKPVSSRGNTQQRTHSSPSSSTQPSSHNRRQPFKGRSQQRHPASQHSHKKPLPTGTSSHKNTPSARTGSRPPRSSRPSQKDRVVVPQKTPLEMIAHIPELGPDDVRVIPICGVEWIGTNMMAIEYRDEIIVVDAGFGFPSPETPGINYTIPDITYLKAKKDNIKALLITHGHMDHVGGIPYVLEDLGYPPIYTREFGAMFIKNRLEEFPKVAKNANIHTVRKDDGIISIGQHFKVRFFGLTHSIPDSTGVIIDTPIGGIVSTGDVRVENNNGVVAEKEIEQYKMFKDENIILMTCDSTGIVKPGWSLSEDVVKENIDHIIKSAKGRLFIAAFSSQVERIMSFIESAKRHNKFIGIDGRSMKSNLAIAKQLKLTDFDHVLSIEEIKKKPADRIVLLVTGAQGEEYSVLDRLGRDSHKQFKLEASDTVVLSSSVVPGNDHSVDRIKDQLYRGSYHIITYADNQVHASGHGAREEIMWIHKQIPYKFFMPVHGNHHRLKIHAKLVHDTLNVPEENIVVPDNGSIIEIREGGNKIVKLRIRAPHTVNIVDGLYVGPMHDVVMRDRLALGENGIFIVVVSLDVRHGKLRKSPDIISRGFVYLRESQKMLHHVRELVRSTVEDQLPSDKGRTDFDDIRKDITAKITRYLRQKTDKDPIVIPVILAL